MTTIEICEGEHICRLRVTFRTPSLVVIFYFFTLRIVFPNIWSRSPLVMFLLTLPVDGNYSQPPLEKIVALFAPREIMKINFFFTSQKRERRAGEFL